MNKTIGIQIGPDSFVDEGTEKVLDLLKERGAVNTIYLSTFTYDRGISSRQMPDKPLPGHGGNFATPHAPFYKNTAIKGEKLWAPDFGKLDILTEVLPKAKKRGMKVVCSVQDGFNYPDDVHFFKDFAEVDLQGRKSGAMCFYQPDVREFWKAVVLTSSSYDIDGILLFNERNGPLLNAIGVSHSQRIDSAKVTCFCEHHQRTAEQHGIGFKRAKEGYLKLNQYVQNSLNGKTKTNFTICY